MRLDTVGLTSALGSVPVELEDVVLEGVVDDAELVDAVLEDDDAVPETRLLRSRTSTSALPLDGGERHRVQRVFAAPFR
jgi:hypothetical protein